MHIHKHLYMSSALTKLSHFELVYLRILMVITNRLVLIALKFNEVHVCPRYKCLNRKIDYSTFGETNSFFLSSSIIQLNSSLLNLNNEIKQEHISDWFSQSQSHVYV